MRIILLTITLGLSLLSFSQPYAGISSKSKKPDISKAAGCLPPTTTTMLELNNVRAMIHTAGNLWQIPGKNYSQYEIPKNSGIMCLFTAALWLGGTDVNNQLKLAALRYRDGQDYWNGPLTKNFADVSKEECLRFDKHYNSTQDDISEFNAWFQAGADDKLNGTNTQSTLFPNYKIPSIIKEWPAHGDVSIGQDYYLAPFYDRNNDGDYNYQDGDYPWYDIDKTKNCKTDKRVSLYGDINFWWVMNDKGNLHTETNADPIGMEIRAQAFAFASNDEVNSMTFYNYELINRGTQTLYNTYFGFFTDGALGNPNDDFVGCDVNRGLGYYYNGNNFDSDMSGFKGYGNNPPAVGVDFFEGPYQDEDGIDNAFGIGVGEALNGIGYGDGIIDNERYGMRRFLYYSNTTNGANPNQTDPTAANDYYNYLRGRWKDGTPFLYGGSGHISDPDANPMVPCDFMFPGDTDPLGWGTGGNPQPLWTEQTAGNVPNDKRFLESAGPFILKPGAVNNITVGITWARAQSGDPFESVKVLKVADDKAQALFENCFKVLEGPHAPNLEIQELNNELVLYLSNPINSNNYQEKYEEHDPFIFSNLPNIDKKYRFQGYQIYQLKSNSITLSDLEDVTKARLVGQCDIKDNFSRIINFEFDENLQASIPVEKVVGENQGIRHSFKLTEDLFASGTAQLVNFKTYYYMAVAYATNNYKTFISDDPLAIDGQRKVYIKSRKAAYGNVKVVAATPHNSLPESDGTLHYLEYGVSPEITRLDGTGNGNRNIELTSNTTNSILESGFISTPSYKIGNGPINVKVIDPLNVVDGYFELKFKNYKSISSYPDYNSADTASWVVYRYDKEGGVLIDSISSSSTIATETEQLIPEWGVSVQIAQNKYIAGSSLADYVTTPIVSSIYFKDSTHRWLTNVVDDAAYFPTNWIRSGVFTPTATDSNSALKYKNPWYYFDAVGLDNNKKFTKIAGGLFAPHRLVGYEFDYMPLAYYNTINPGTLRNNASISFSPSVDIVLTNDQSKWTRCPVLELGRNSNLTVGNAKAGALRKSPSVGKDGLPDSSGDGMGWFPGYAIDVESGARLYLAFGENSFLQADNGGDMIWNPSARYTDNLGNPVFGGQHAIYVFNYKAATINGTSSFQDLGAYNEINNELYDAFSAMINSNSNSAKNKVYANLAWIGNPILLSGQKLMSSDVTVKIRVNKEYKNYSATGLNSGKPMYAWNMSGLSTLKDSEDALKETLSLINVVPNPYYAYSQYERTKIDSRVKITNLPQKCTIRIYSASGKLMKTFKKDSPQTFIDWDLNNEIGIQTASGVYLIHVEVPGIGEKVIKLFAAMRQVDLQNF